MTDMAHALERLAHDGKPGEQLVYHVGFLWCDRNSDRDNDGHSKISETADAALYLSEQKLLHVFQKRIANGGCQYLAIKASDAGHALIKRCAASGQFGSRS
jgi:hypothetical protein